MQLPDDFTLPTRSEIVASYERDVKVRQPNAKVGDGTLATIDAKNCADLVLPIYANSKLAFQNTTLEDADEEGLEEKASAKGLPKRLLETGGSGFVKCAIASGGVFIAAGKIIKDDKAALRFECTSGRIYGVDPLDVNVPVRGVDVGPSTNIAAGTTLRWESPPAGLAELATVVADANGRGFSGGRNKETLDELRARIADAEADPAAAGNAAQVRDKVIKAAVAKGIPVQAVFVYGAVLGPNTYAVVVTLRPEKPGGSRSPTSVQLAELHAYIANEFPFGDGIFFCELLDEDQELLLEVKWSPGADGWVDLTQYPQRNTVSPAVVSAVTSATAFQVDSDDVPQIGQSIAFFDSSGDEPRFVRKKILTVSGAGPYDLTIDTTNSISDLVYVPSVGEKFCPWSDSLQLLVAPILAHFDTLGPGEQVESADLFDPGERLRRNPAPTPQVWPSELTSRVLGGLDNETAVANVEVHSPDIPIAPSVGAPGVYANILTLGRLLAFPS